MPNELIRVFGTVTDRNGAPFQGLNVQLLAGQIPLGQSNTTAEGGYDISVDVEALYQAVRETGAKGIELRAYRGRALVAESEIIKPSKKDMQIDLQSAVERAIARAPRARVSGRVFDAKGNPTAGVTVVIADRDLRSDEELARGTTATDGSYAIEYEASKAKRLEFGAPDIVVIVRGGSGEGKEVIRSRVHFAAPSDLTVNLELPAETVRPEALFDRMQRRILPLLGDVNPWDLDETARDADLSFLAGDTGHAFSEVAAFAVAYRLGHESEAEHFWFAALIKTGFTAEPGQPLAPHQINEGLKAIASLEARDLQKLMERAVKDAVIAPVSAAKIRKWVSSVQDIAGGSLAVPETGKPAQVGVILDVADVPKKARATAAVLIERAGVFDADLAKRIGKETGLDAPKVERLRTVSETVALAGGETAAAVLASKTFGVKTRADIRSLAKLPPAEWEKATVDAAKQGLIDIAPTFGGAGAIDVSAAVLGRSLSQRFAAAYPTAQLSGALERNDAGDGAGTARPFEGIEKPERLGKFFEAHPDLEITRTPLDRYLGEKVSPDWADEVKTTEFRHQLQSLQRLTKLGSSPALTDALLADKVHSASMIYRMGESRFVTEYGGAAPGGAVEARRVWRQAADTHTSVASLIAELRAHHHEDLPAALKIDTEALEEFPNWRNLFEGGDVCTCEHCRSVLSPAAYFADVLMFLRDRRTDDGSSDLKSLVFDRRPDLATLELNCDNALTPLPYTDVVNEVLEAHIADGASDVTLTGLSAMDSDPDTRADEVAEALRDAGLEPGDQLAVTEAPAFGADQWIGHGTALVVRLFKNGGSDYVARIAPNSKAPASELRAFPQYTDAAAYQTLASARRLPTLPFDLPNTEVRAAFGKIGRDRAKLMRAMRTGTAPHNPTDAEIAAVHLGIAVGAAPGTDELELIAQRNTQQTHLRQVWGVSGSTWIDKLAVVRTFLDITGLEYNDLLILLDLSFINPDGTLFIKHEDATCDLDTKFIEGLDVEVLDRIHRFYRLWRKLPDWSMAELNAVIMAGSLGDSDLDHDLLVHLSGLVRLKARLGRKATVEALISLFEDIPNDCWFIEPFEERRTGFHDSLFQNLRLTRPLDPGFAIDPATGDLPGGSLDASRAGVQAGTRLSSSDLDLLLLFERPNGNPYVASDTLNRRHLSFLWRHAFVARALRMKVSDWTTALRMTGSTWETFGDPAQALDLIEHLDRLAKSDLSVDQIDWILTGNREADAADDVDEQEAVLLALRTEVQALRAAFDPAQYPELAAPTDADAPALQELFTLTLQSLGRGEDEVAFAAGAVVDTATAEAPVSGLPAGFAFDVAITSQMPISLSTDETLLRFQGVMTDAQRTVLLTNAAIPAAVRGLPSYQQAVTTLHEAARLSVKFYEPSFSAPLEALPDGMDFTALGDSALEARVIYDGRTRQLTVRGVLSADERDRLTALTVDADFGTAITTIYDAPRAEPVEWIDLDAFAAPLDDPANIAANLAPAITDALTYLATSRSDALVRVRVAEELELDSALTDHVLAQDRGFPTTLLHALAQDLPLSSGPIDEALQPVLVQRWLMARRLALLLAAWKLDAQDYTHLADMSVETDGIDLTALPVQPADPPVPLGRFSATEHLLAIRDNLAETNRRFLDLLADLKSGAVPDEASFGLAVEEIDERFQASDVEALATVSNLALPNDMFRARTWARFLDAFSFMGALACDGEAARNFAKAGMNADDAEVLRQLLAAKYGETTWATLGGEIQDVLRDRKREALVAYLLSQPAPADNPSGKWATANDLYSYFLLDVEMSSCMMTSRLVVGANSLQLFVHRCLMGLEPEVLAVGDGPDGDSAWRWWEWMRKYRVWEANRKVFLFPENWIEPELKPDRSPFFRSLEADLQKNEINRDTAEDAFRAYLEKLDDVADLEIAAFYQEDDGDNTILHVFGRNNAVEPHLYHYRTYDYRQWSPWQKIDLEITGDYLIPMVVGGRVYLFWPVFTEAPDEDAIAATPYPQSDGSQIEEVPKRLRVQLAVSDLRQGQWTPKRMSKDMFESASFTRAIVKRRYKFHAIERSGLDGRAAITFEGHSETAEGFHVAHLSGTFDISGCRGVPEIGSTVPMPVNAVRVEMESVGYYTDFARWKEIYNREDKDNDFALVGEGSVMAGYFARLLEETPGLFAQRPGWQYSEFDKMLLGAFRAIGALGIIDWSENSASGLFLPFFYSDRNRTFFAQPFIRQVVGREEEPIYFDYNDAKRFIGLFEDLLRGFVAPFVAALPLPVAGDRTNIENTLKLVYGLEAQPPYSDELLRELLGRWLVDLFIRGPLGAYAAYLMKTAKWQFSTHYHPFVCDFLSKVNNPLEGIPGLMRRETQLMETPFRFYDTYRPTNLVIEPTNSPSDPHSDKYPKEDVDFRPEGAYAPYNWEIFYHAPLLIADSLSRNQRFEEAREWYHHIFNPLGVDGPGTGGAATSRYWITKPFYEMTTDDYIAQRIDTIMHLIAGDTNTPGYSAAAKKALEDQVRDWRENPFEPHRIANYRQVAYQKTAVMKYLDNLIRWGDHLFRQDSMESITEATQLYVMAAEILGPRPRAVAPAARPVDQTFAELEGKLDAFSNALIEFENLVPGISPQFGASTAVNLGSAPPVPMLYFCIPRNDKLLGYWDTVADRLHKIRNCMNIDGVRRTLALFEPEIDPGALVKAVAGGGGIAGALADLNAPLPPYRFHVALQQANQLCGDLKSLGSALLTALEKKDAEELALLRQGQEIAIQKAAADIAKLRIDEAKEQLSALRESKKSAEFRRDTYDDREFMNVAEGLAAGLTGASILLDIPISVGYIASGVLKLIPNFLLGASGFGGSPHATGETGGQAFGDAAKFAIEGLGHIARNLDKIAGLTSTIASYERRQEDWDLQRDLAEHEIEQLEHSIRAAELRVETAQAELAQQMQRIEDSSAVDEFMRSKYTNAELYQWQISQISSVYMQSFQLAYDLAKQCERAMSHELARGDTAIVQTGHWDSLKKGLHAGDRLQLDLRRLEAAYNERNKRELELEKRVSLASIDPLALIRLRETGRCEFSIDEHVFDHDWPGHYFRRIKSVHVSMPCVVGPQTSLSCSVRLLSNQIRINTLDGDNGYPRNTDDSGLPAPDSRFIQNQVPVRSIGVSRGVDDAGVFNLDFKDTRYLPFEGSGAISRWSVELLNDPDNADFGRPLRQFDYSTISDVILHIRYTAREDAGPFRTKALQTLRDRLQEADATPVLRAFDLRREFPVEWQRFLFPEDPLAGNVMDLSITRDMFRYLGQDSTLKVNTLWVMARCSDGGDYTVRLQPPLPAGNETMTLAKLDSYGGLHVADQQPVSTFDVTLEADGTPSVWQLSMTRPGGSNLQSDAAAGTSEVEDLLLVVGYQLD